MKILAIIPARGGSKRIPHKNSILLQEKPLIEYTIAAAKESREIEHVIVSTEDPLIQTIASELDVEVLPRPDYLASDTVRNDEVVAHIFAELNVLARTYDVVALLQPTSPLRTAQHLDDCICQFKAGFWVSAMSVCEIEQHPAKAITIQDGLVEPLLGEKYFEEQSQKLPKVYRQNGAIYLTRASEFMKQNKFYQNPCMPYIMAKEDSIDIDEMADLIKVSERMSAARELKEDKRYASEL